MKIMRQTVVQQVIEFIRKNIENGTWKVGEKIPSEHALTELLGVSRASARVAIQQYIAIGALESLHGKGTFVLKNDLSSFWSRDHKINKSDCEDIRKVLEFRKLIEPEGSYLAAQFATVKTIEKLKRHLKNMKENIGNSKKFMEEDASFHEEIALASQNHLIYKSVKQVFDTSENDHVHLIEVYGYKDGIYDHTVLLKAIIDKDPKSARKAMLEQLQFAIDRMK